MRTLRAKTGPVFAASAPASPAFLIIRAWMGRARGGKRRGCAQGV